MQRQSASRCVGTNEICKRTLFQHLLPRRLALRASAWHYLVCMDSTFFRAHHQLRYRDRPRAYAPARQAYRTLQAA